jgi:S-adenosylmethionine-dependent methyltransferase
MPTLDTARFQAAAKYASYLKTVAGKLRSELAWKNLREFLPDSGFPGRALDLGGGTGFHSVRLAKMGLQVVLVDSSEEMLAVAQKEAEAAGIAGRIGFHHADAGQLTELFEPESFEFVVCHNLLEYVEDPGAIVQSVSRVMRKDALVSVLVRNRAGEVLKAAIKSEDWRLARANLAAQTVVDSLFGKPARVFDSADVAYIFAQAGLGAVAEYGVRVFSDYVDSEDLDSENYSEILELEFILGAQPKFAAIARYTQLIGRPCTASQVLETGR